MCNLNSVQQRPSRICILESTIWSYIQRIDSNLHRMQLYNGSNIYRESVVLRQGCKDIVLAPIYLKVE